MARVRFSSCFAGRALRRHGAANEIAAAMYVTAFLRIGSIVESRVMQRGGWTHGRDHDQRGVSRETAAAFTLEAGSAGLEAMGPGRAKTSSNFVEMPTEPEFR
jgi:hypothetical protein